MKTTLHPQCGPFFLTAESVGACAYGTGALGAAADALRENLTAVLMAAASTFALLVSRAALLDPRRGALLCLVLLDALLLVRRPSCSAMLFICSQPPPLAATARNHCPLPMHTWSLLCARTPRSSVMYRTSCSASRPARNGGSCAERPY